MDNYIIEIKNNLTSYVFYNTLLPKLHDYYVKNSQEKLVFDFSQVKSIDPTVIPNLLCVGYIISSYSNEPAELLISNNIISTELKRYLNEIKFIKYAEMYNLFSFDDSLKGGWTETKMSPLNTTLLFNSTESEEETWSKLIRINNFLSKYLSEFNLVYNSSNLILELSKEIIQNSKIHGRSFAFMTLQYNYLKEKVYLSYSDCGIGFMNSLNEAGKSASDELEAICEGIFSRYGKPFGLYNVISRIINRNGIVRIHSNNTQLILTNKDILGFDIIKSAESFKRSLNLKTDVRKNLKYAGVHIEIELPLAKEEIVYDK